MRMENAKSIAERCPHFGMCKIDFLGTGLCPSGIKYKYASYYPQGRMEIVNALANGLIPVTEKLIHIANSCTLCGKCDKQCYFMMELRALKVMEALKEYVESHLEENKPIERPEEDEVLRDLRAVVGSEWATNDPAILVAYSRDVSPLSPRRMPKYVVMSESTIEVAEVIRVANEHKVPFVPRGTGAGTWALALGEGIIIDLYRMRMLQIDPENWTATVGAGVTGFELQREASKHKMRVHVAEPEACVCANIVFTGIYSPFSHGYGIAADNYIDAEIVTSQGEVFRLEDKDAPNLFAFSYPAPGSLPPSPGMCTQITTKLYPMAEDEEGIFVPFSDFHEALAMAREIGRRRIGFAAAVISIDYFSMFGSPTFKVSEEFTRVAKDKMKVEYLLMVLGDKYDMRTIKEIADVTIDQEMARILILGAPRLYGNEGVELLSQLPGSKEPYKDLFGEDMRPLVEISLSPSPNNIAEVVDEDLRDFFRELYSKPEMTNPVWLNMFRILCGRMGRNHGFVARVFFCSLDNLDTVVEICEAIKAIGEKYGLRNRFGFLTPIDFGKRAVLEWDYYFDQTDNRERENAKNATLESAGKMADLMQEIKGIRPFEIVVFQGLSRKENVLYT